MYISEIISYLNLHLQETDITLNEGATDYEIFQFELAFDIKLPDDFKDFYKFANGFHSAEDDFNIVPLEEIIERKEDKNSEICIAEYLIYCDMWELEVNANDPNQYSITYITNDGKIILTNSFADFLEVFLTGGVFEAGGLYDWLNMLTKKSNI